MLNARPDLKSVAFIILSDLTERIGPDIVVQNDVDHTGNRIGTVLGGGTVAQNLDALDGRGRKL